MVVSSYVTRYNPSLTFVTQYSRMESTHLGSLTKF